MSVTDLFKHWDTIYRVAKDVVNSTDTAWDDRALAVLDMAVRGGWFDDLLEVDYHESEKLLDASRKQGVSPQSVLSLLDLLRKIFSRFHPTKPPVPPVDPPPSPGPSAALVYELINAHRAANHLPPYLPNDRLALAAAYHSADMAERNHQTHDGGDGSNFAERLSRAGYTGQPRGEIIAGDPMNYFSTAEKAVDAWKQSPGHNALMLDGAADQCGAGVAVSSTGGSYWCVDFGVSRSLRMGVKAVDVLLPGPVAVPGGDA